MHFAPDGKRLRRRTMVECGVINSRCRKVEMCIQLGVQNKDDAERVGVGAAVNALA